MTQNKHYTIEIRPYPRLDSLESNERRWESRDFLRVPGFKRFSLAFVVRTVTLRKNTNLSEIQAEIPLVIINGQPTVHPIGFYGTNTFIRRCDLSRLKYENLIDMINFTALVDSKGTLYFKTIEEPRALLDEIKTLLMITQL